MTEAVPRTILTVAVSQEDAEKLILADRTTDLTVRATGRGDQVVRPARRQPRRHPAGDLPEGCWMTAIVETDRSRLSVLQAMLHGSVPLGSMEALNDHVASNPQEFAVVVGPSVDVQEAAVFAQWARVHKPDLGVILLRETVDAHALSTALRSGMREVVESKDLAGLTTAVAGPEPSRPPSRRRWRARARLPPRQQQPLRSPTAHAQAEAAREEAERPDRSDADGVLDQGGRRQEPDGRQHRESPWPTRAARSASSTSTSTTATSPSCSSSPRCAHSTTCRHFTARSTSTRSRPW